MMIDWFTLGAQVINFVVLMALLNHFLYRPVSRLITEKQLDSITKQQQLADNLQTAEQLKADYQQQLDDLANTRQQRLDELNQQIKSIETQLLAEAKIKVAEARQNWLNQLHTEQQQQQADIQILLQQQVFSILRKLLQDFADTSLESQLVKLFVRHLSQLPDADQHKLLQQLHDQPKIIIKTPYSLDNEDQNLIQFTLTQLSAQAYISFTYQQDETIGLGIELLIGSYLLSWRVDSYLAELESATLKALQESTHG